MSDAGPEHKCEWQAKAAALEARIAELEKLLYGKKSEKLPRPAQELKKRGDITAPDPEALRQKRAEGQAWKQDLPEEPVVHALLPASEACKVCGTLPDHPMPPEVSYEYEWVPGKLKRLKHVREGARCQCGACIVRGPAPVRVVDKMQYGPGLAAHAVVSKCCDAMPLYRQAQQLARIGVPISAKTLGDLFHRSAELLGPLHRRLLELVAQEPVVQGDETRIQVQHKDKTRRAWMWVFLARAAIVYVYSPSRSGDTPKRVLGATNGTLVVDAYTGYNQVCTPEQRERAGCLAHVRRKLFDALSTAPAMREGLDLILDVYKVEHEAKELGIVRTPAHRDLRLARSKPAMDRLHAWLLDQQPKYLPTEPAGKAVGYALDNWPHLTVFLTRAEVPPDNNLSEAALRIVAKTRDSSLFVGNDMAGENLAVLLTLVQSAQAAGHNPQQYLADVLIRVQSHPMARLDELLPQNWRAVA